MIELLEKDWKQAAAQAGGDDEAATQNTEEIEKAFLEQAYSAVATKAQALMKAPYRIGFETISKDQDYTRMVGIFVFRVNKELFYAPVFFLNGSIKGTDLLYRHKVKRFVPLTQPWIEYLIAMAEQGEGKGVPVTYRSQMRNQLYLRDIVNPPNSSHKYASDHGPNIRPASPETLAAWEEMIKPAAELEPGLLKRFIAEDGGFNAMAKIAYAAKRDFDFANALFLSGDIDSYRPALEATVKSAAVTEPENLISVHTGLLFNQEIKSASLEEMKAGYKIEDFRKEAMEAVFAPASEDLQTVEEPGVYEVLKSDGSTGEMICAYEDTALHLDRGGSIPTTAHVYSGGQQPDFVLVDTGSKASKQLDNAGVEDRRAYGKFLHELKEEKSLVKVPEKGKCYRICNLHRKSLSTPFYVLEVKTGETGLQQVFYSTSRTTNPHETPLTLNPDYEGFDPGDQVLGACCQFVEVGHKKEESGYINYDRNIPLGSYYALNSFIFDHGYKRAAIKKIESGGFLVKENADHGGRGWTCELGKLAGTIGLMTHFNLRQGVAEELLKMAAETGQVSFLYRPLEKTAHNLNFANWPQLSANFNDEFGVLEEPQTRHALRVDKTFPYIQRHRIGDQSTFDPAAKNMDTASPTELYQMSKEKGVGNLFDHGAVGSLIDTYDSASMIDKWLPDLEKALDRLGRLLFLFYWKPEDFRQAYGSDDQGQLENKLTSNYKSFGDLVIELLQKSQHAQQGTVSLNS